MSAKSSYYHGDLNAFTKRLNRYQKLKGDFDVISSGISQKIEFPGSDIKFRFFGTNNAHNRIPGSHFAPIVQSCVDKWIENKPTPPIVDKPDIQLFNFDLIKKNTGKKIVAVDANLCYWTTAYKLGFISEDIFIRGLQFVEAGKTKTVSDGPSRKVGLLVSIGCLNKKPIKKTYRGGVLTHSEPMMEIHNRYSPFYWAIICHVRDIMMQSFMSHKKDWYMWLTDCCFVSESKAEEMISFFNEHGYGSKTYEVILHGLDGTKLKWQEVGKTGIKSIGTSNRDIKFHYDLYRANGRPSIMKIIHQQTNK